jgi:SAM-dependent methyltransferase
MDVRAAEWDARYAAVDRVWSTGPNVFVEEICAALPPGRCLDVAGGEGRNALWLADRGWEATVADFSAVALQRAAHLWDQREERTGRLHVRQVDVLADPLGDQSFDLVLVCYLQVPAEARRTAHLSAAAAVAPGGTLLVVAHHTDNLADGVGGPQDPAVLFSEDDVVADLAGTGLETVSAVKRERGVEQDGGAASAYDVVVVARRPL